MNLQNQIDYLKEFNDQDMFDDCSVPSPLDMQRVRGAIVMRCGLLTPLYSEPETQRAATQQFFFENQWNFAHIVKIIEAEYSPIENVAEWRNEKTKNSGADTLTISKNSTETHSGTDERSIKESGNTIDSQTGETRTEHEISAENATTYQEDNLDVVTHGRIDTTTHGKGTKDDLTHGEVISHGGSDTHKTEKGSSTDYDVYRHGNVGVTTNQFLIDSEISLLERFNPYRFIADLYEKELILGLY